MCMMNERFRLMQYIRYGTLQVAASDITLAVTSKTSTPSTLLATAVSSLPVAATRPFGCGISPRTSRFCSSTLKTVSPRLRSRPTTRSSQLARLTRACASGIQAPVSFSSVWKEKPGTKTASTLLPSRRMAETSSAAVWTRRSRCGSCRTRGRCLAVRRRMESACARLRVTRYVDLVAFQYRFLILLAICHILFINLYETNKYFSLMYRTSY